MKTNWDYTSLAKAYLKRPSYSDEAIEKMLQLANISKGDMACDVGAGTAHLTIALADHGLSVTAIEPNDAMREQGVKRTKGFDGISWHTGTGEDTQQESGCFDIVTFGSSFNVTNQQAALKETHRILKPNSWFAAMWNHRNLSDPIQKDIEEIISGMVPNYSYGTRRKDQTAIIAASGLFGKVERIEGNVCHTQKINDVIKAWRSHATLQRQAKENFYAIVKEIENYLQNLQKKEISIPYTTRIWIAQAL